MKLRPTCLAMAVCIAATNAWAYDAAADFSLAGNPNGVWSYGYSLNSGSQYAFVPFDTVTDTGTGQHWSKSGYNVLNTPSAWKNTDPNKTTDGVGPGQLSLHAGPDAASTAILRFTSEADAIYRVDLQFFAGDSGSTLGSVILNGDGAAPWYPATSTNSGLSHADLVYLGAGYTFDMALDKVGSFHAGNTPVALSISAVPEPASAALWLAGLLLVPLFKQRLAAARNL